MSKNTKIDEDKGIINIPSKNFTNFEKFVKNNGEIKELFFERFYSITDENNGETKLIFVNSHYQVFIQLLVGNIKSYIKMFDQQLIDDNLNKEMELKESETLKNTKHKSGKWVFGEGFYEISQLIYLNKGKESNLEIKLEEYLDNIYKISQKEIKEREMTEAWIVKQVEEWLKNICKKSGNKYGGTFHKLKFYFPVIPSVAL
uniref:Uncharacterized protein n=1 Tax=Meloidogyne floridensis TaxID=298350 RepID=A0A915NH41_9BILA